MLRLYNAPMSSRDFDRLLLLADAVVIAPGNARTFATRVLENSASDDLKTSVEELARIDSIEDVQAASLRDNMVGEVLRAALKRHSITR